MNLTAAIDQDYHAPITAKSVIGIGVLSSAAKSRNDSCNAAFLRLAVSSMGGLGGEPQGSPVRVPGTPTRLVPLTRLESGVRLNKLNGERIMTKSIKSAVKLVHGKATTTSLKISEVFGKQHFHVIRAIEKLDCSDEFNASNFGCIDYIDKRGRTKKSYTITKNGFMFLAMGFTGKEAAQWKEKFIEEFDRLERLVLVKSTTRQSPRELPAPKQYHYPRKLLEQTGFITTSSPAALNIAMLSSKNYVSPLLYLLNELRSDGHEITAAWDEAIALRDGVIHADAVLEKISLDAIRAYSKPASTAKRS